MAKADIIWHANRVKREQREALTGVKPAVLWLTGLSGSGKSTLAMALELALIEKKCVSYVLDGDNVRHDLNKDLGFSEQDRKENIRRVGEVTKLFVDAGVMVIASFISPRREDRQGVRKLMSEGEFIEIFVDAPLAVCEGRDPKGLYKKARAAITAGNPMAFTGLDAAYEAPTQPEIHVQSDRETVEEGVEKVLAYLLEKGRLRS